MKHLTVSVYVSNNAGDQYPTNILSLKKKNQAVNMFISAIKINTSLCRLTCFLNQPYLKYCNLFSSLHLFASKFQFSGNMFCKNGLCHIRLPDL